MILRARPCHRRSSPGRSGTGRRAVRQRGLVGHLPHRRHRLHLLRAAHRLPRLVARDLPEMMILGRDLDDHHAPRHSRGRLQGPARSLPARHRQLRPTSKQPLMAALGSGPLAGQLGDGPPRRASRRGLPAHPGGSSGSRRAGSSTLPEDSRFSERLSGRRPLRMRRSSRRCREGRMACRRPPVLLRPVHSQRLLG